MPFLKIVPPSERHTCSFPHVWKYGIGTIWQCEWCNKEYTVKVWGYDLPEWKLTYPTLKSRFTKWLTGKKHV